MPRTTPPARPDSLAHRVSARLRLWSQLWQRHARGDHLAVSGGDALRARAEQQERRARSGGARSRRPGRG